MKQIKRKMSTYNVICSLSFSLRVLEMKHELYKMEILEYSYFDDLLTDMKLTPVNLIVVYPCKTYIHMTYYTCVVVKGYIKYYTGVPANTLVLCMHLHVLAIGQGY